MKLSALTLTALAAVGLAQDVRYDCYTTEGSPMLHHVNELIENTANAEAGKTICVSYILGSDDCTGTIRDYSGDGGAALQMCKGGSDEQLYRCQAQPPGSPIPPGTSTGLPVKMVSQYFEKLRDDCVNTIDDVERVGGSVVFNDGGAELRLITIPG